MHHHLSRAAQSRRLDPVDARIAEIEKASGMTITLQFTSPWEGPGYWHGFANAENSFRPGSRTVASVDAEFPMEALDKLAVAMGVAA